MSKVLLADDSTHAQRMGTKILAGEGLEVVTVNNGEAAVKKLAADTYDLILADVFMPGRSGYEVCSYVKNSPKLAATPVILIVGLLEPYDADQGKSVGADAVLRKPFETTVVVETVRGLMAAAAKRRAAAPPDAPHEKTQPIAPETVANALARADQAAAAEFQVETPQARIEVPADMQDLTLDLGDHVAIPGEFSPLEDLVAEPRPQPEFPTIEIETGPEPAAPPTEAPAEAPPAIEMAEAIAAPVEPAAPPAEEVAGLAAAPEAMAAAAAQAPAAPAFMPPEAPPLGEIEIEIEAAAASPAIEAAAPAVAAPEPAPEPAKPRWIIEPEAVPESDYDALAQAAPVPTVEEAEPRVELEQPAPVEEAPVQETPVLEAPVLEAPVEEALVQEAPLEEAAPAPPVAEEEPVLADVETPAAAPEPRAEQPAAVPEVPDWADLLETVEQTPPPQPQQPIEPAPVVPAAAEAVSEAEVRAAVEAGLHAVLPGITSVPGLIDSIVREIQGRFKLSR